GARRTARAGGGPGDRGGRAGHRQLAGYGDQPETGQRFRGAVEGSPMLKGATARRYAQAVFELATEQRTQERWMADLRGVEEYLGNRQLAFSRSEPNVQFGRKEQVVRDLLGGKVQQDALGLALLLVERGLVSLAPRIRFEFERMYDEFLGQAHAEVTTATP